MATYCVTSSLLFETLFVDCVSLDMYICGVSLTKYLSTSMLQYVSVPAPLSALPPALSTLLFLF